MDELLHSKKIKLLLAVLGSLVVMLLVFQLGVFVGVRKATFAYGWGDNYRRNFGMPARGPLGELEGLGFIGGHGVAGEVIKIDGQDLVIKGIDNTEKIIQISNSTTIRRGRENISLADVKVDDGLVVIGQPNNDGSIFAKLVRIFDTDNPPGPPMQNQPQINFNQ
ncbi:MAG: hypothetical protein HY918_03480 [Candidatus Doudnabacteria bacterium]|nr:hypothetical protein [Candidatus Doudnabacteria bacterium]